MEYTINDFKPGCRVTINYEDYFKVHSKDCETTYNMLYIATVVSVKDNVVNLIEDGVQLTLIQQDNQNWLFIIKDLETREFEYVEILYIEEPK